MNVSSPVALAPRPPRHGAPAGAVLPIEYFAGEPASHDVMWCSEIASVYEHCQGRGADIGCGRRTIAPDTIRVDASLDHAPDHVADACLLPFADGELDFVFSGHTIEHLLDPPSAIREWLRVVRIGGHVCVVVPNTIFTQGQNTDPTPHRYEWAPWEFLTDVLGVARDRVTPWFTVRADLPTFSARLIWCGEAAPFWSAAFVLEKCA